MSSSPSSLLAAADRVFLPSMLRRRRILLCKGGESSLRDSLLGWLEGSIDTERWNFEGCSMVSGASPSRAAFCFCKKILRCFYMRSFSATASSWPALAAPPSLLNFWSLTVRFLAAAMICWNWFETSFSCFVSSYIEGLSLNLIVFIKAFENCEARW